MTRITLAEARQRLGQDTFIILEPDAVVANKVGAGKGDELWGFDLETAQLRRGDGRFHAAGVVRHPGGWYLAAIVEEPSSEPPATGPHIIGHVVVEVNPQGLVRTRTAKGLNGDVLELKPSSLSKGELDESGREPDGLYEANPQRITGSIAVYRQDVDFQDEEGMDPREFARQSTDGRSLAALAILGLL